VSIVIAALTPAVQVATLINMDGTGRLRARSIAAEAAAMSGTTPGSQTYTWNNVRPGTFLYSSGSHLTLQTHMGLYGAIKKDAAAGQAYPGISYDSEAVLIYSEIDRPLHDPPTAANPLNYKPTWYLVNGQPYTSGAAAINAGGLDERILIRFLNAGLKDHVPTIIGPNWTVVAEDGNPYTYKKEQYSLLLPSGQTRDVLWNPKANGTYAVYDRSHHLTNGGALGGGMIAKLAVGTGGGIVADADPYSVAEDAVLTIAAPGVLDGDTPAGTLTAELVSGTASGSLALAADGSFTYTPSANFAGSDAFTYRAKDGAGAYSNLATVTITVNPVNDAPAAAADAITAQSNPFTLAAPGVLANDSDVEGDNLTAVLVPGTAPVGFALNANGSFTFSSTADYSFQYQATDGTDTSAPVTVTVDVALLNQAPVAVNDYKTAKLRTAANQGTYQFVVINVVVNDKDSDGTINAATVVPTTAKTSRGGTIAVVGDGTVTYLPPLNFLGTDTFRYTVRDNQGAQSNAATVMINVVR
jgi:FtsP/CotA-like multicopper oxidase with cupredoxin domain